MKVTQKMKSMETQYGKRKMDINNEGLKEIRKQECVKVTYELFLSEI
jgi:hypothetical protein